MFCIFGGNQTIKSFCFMEEISKSHMGGPVVSGGSYDRLKRDWGVLADDVDLLALRAKYRYKHVSMLRELYGELIREHEWFRGAKMMEMGDYLVLKVNVRDLPEGVSVSQVQAAIRMIMGDVSEVRLRI